MRDDVHFEMLTSLSQAALEQTPKKSKLFVYSLIVTIIALVVWAYYSKVDQLIRANGKVVAYGQNQIIQNLEGGIVSKIMINEGTLVTKGQTLIQIDNQRFISDFEKNQIEIYELRARLQRLGAESDEKPFLYVPSGNVQYDAFLRKEYRLYQSNRSQFINRKSIIEEQIEQKRKERSELQSRIKNSTLNYQLIKEEMDSLKPLVIQGLVSKMEALKLKRDVTKAKDELDSARLTLPIIESSIQEQKQRLADVTHEFKTIARKELNEASSMLDQLERLKTNFKDQVTRTTVTSPVDGIVKRVFVNTQGGVVKPGMDLVEIVPEKEELIIQAKVSPSDIGFVHKGQQATIKLTAYDFAIFGSLSAEVVKILPDAITEKENEIFYQVYLKVEPASNTKITLIPGMIASVDIISGQRTVLEYLLKPIIKSRYYSFTEK